MKAVKGEEVILVAENKIGKLNEVSGVIADNGVNVRALNAYAIEDKAIFRLVTSDNTKAKDILKNLGTVKGKEVVIIDMPDEVGQLHNFASRIKDAGVDLIHIYGTTSTPGAEAIMVISSNNNDKIMDVLSS